MSPSNSLATLSLATLPDLPQAVGRPDYKREALSPGIVHFGPGNFHRAHQCVYLDALMNEGRDHDWSIIGASVMKGDGKLRQLLLDQDLLTTVVAQSADENTARVTGVMTDYLPIGDTAAILETLTAPHIRIVSMTVTEGGYFVDADTGEFDPTSDAIVADANNMEAPATVFGLIVRALRDRRDAGVDAFTVMSCDNLPHNGVIARGAVVGLAKLVDADLATWIDTHSSFPNGMVDRIAPATGDRERRLVREDHGIDDDAPVFCEDHLQWVLEDKFVAGRPAFDTVGAQFVDDVTPFETMKIRMLNGGHALIAYPAGLLDIEYADQAMQHPLISRWLDKVERTEIQPMVPPVPDTDLDEYLKLITRRFANPKIGDTIRRLCLDGSNRQPKFILPTLRDRLAAGEGVDGLALASAFWCRYCYGETESGQVIEPNDPSWERLTELAKQAKDKPLVWLGIREVYGKLAEDKQFQSVFAAQLESLWKDGTEAALTSYLDADKGSARG